MLNKYPKTVYRNYIKTGAKLLIIVEAIAFVGSYGIWYKLNTSRDFRYYMQQNYPSILDGYYKIGELFNKEDHNRELDLTVWKQEGHLPGSD